MNAGEICNKLILFDHIQTRFSHKAVFGSSTFKKDIFFKNDVLPYSYRYNEFDTLFKIN